MGIRSFAEFQEIKTMISNTQGVTQLSADTVTPGLFTLSVGYTGEMKSLMDQWKLFFADKYQLTEKRLPNGEAEIELSPLLL